MKWTLLLSSTLLLPISSYGAIQLSDSFSLGGFGHVSATKTDNEVPVFTNRDISDEWCYDCDTTLGLQLDWQMTDHLRSSFQAVKRPQDHFSSPDLEWAYLAYDYKNFTFRAGRLRLPMFLMSEYYYVSYAYPWLRPPQDIYDSLLGVTSFNGVSATWDGWIQDTVGVSITPFATIPNKNEYDVVGVDVTIDSDVGYGLNANFYYDDTYVNFTAFRTTYDDARSIEVMPGMVLNLGENKNETLTLFSIGIEQYFGNWRILGETLLSQHNYANWYASVDYSFDKLTPYITYSQQRISRSSRQVLLGLRYDVNQYIAFNIETQYIWADINDAGIAGQFTDRLGANAESDVDIVTLGLVFTF
ncbi:hypothetical protein BCU68_11570 [Vibrio sp. 10N.286.49.B3]|nr:hypothetical protein BCU68_11570 [Vibrio sp. 10N.286.49.B3]